MEKLSRIFGGAFPHCVYELGNIVIVGNENTFKGPFKIKGGIKKRGLKSPQPIGSPPQLAQNVP